LIRVFGQASEGMNDRINNSKYCNKLNHPWRGIYFMRIMLKTNKMPKSQEKFSSFLFSLI